MEMGAGLIQRSRLDSHIASAIHVCIRCRRTDFQPLYLRYRTEEHAMVSHSLSQTNFLIPSHDYSALGGAAKCI